MIELLNSENIIVFFIKNRNILLEVRGIMSVWHEKFDYIKYIFLYYRVMRHLFICDRLLLIVATRMVTLDGMDILEIDSN